MAIALNRERFAYDVMKQGLRLGGAAMVKFLVVAISAILMMAIAILSVQNGTSVSIAFLNGETTALPVGLWLAFAVGAGMLGTALLLSLGKKKKARY